jgi:hypothetical protein
MTIGSKKTQAAAGRRAKAKAPAARPKPPAPRPKAPARPAGGTTRASRRKPAVQAATKKSARRPAPTARPVAARAGSPRAGAAKPRRAPARTTTARAKAPVLPSASETLPESYGENRVRLLAKDPRTLYAFWDVDAEAQDALRNELGERGAALSRLTLRVGGEGPAPAVTVMVPEGARGYYLQAEPWRPTFRAQLGFTLPSGEFRVLASSNEVSLPPAGPSPVRATERVRFDAAAPPPEKSLPLRTGVPPATEARPAAKADRPSKGRGGASDLHRR